MQLKQNKTKTQTKPHSQHMPVKLQENSTAFLVTFNSLPTLQGVFYLRNL